MNRSIKTTLMSCVATLALAAAANAQVIGIGLNFTDGWPTPMLGGETADGFSNWTDSRAANDWTDPSFGSITLLGSSVTATWNSANTWAGGREDTSEQQLYRVYLDDGDGGNSLVAGDGIGASVTISGLSAWLAANGVMSYRVRCYSSTDMDNPLFQPVSIRSGAPNSADGVNQLLNLSILETIAMPVLGPGDFPPNTTPDTTWGMWQARGYAYSTSTFSDDVITLTIPARNGTTRGTLAGFMIVIPEPSSALLGGLGALMLAVLRRRR